MTSALDAPVSAEPVLAQPILVSLTGSQGSSTIRANIMFFDAAMDTHTRSTLTAGSVVVRHLVDISTILLEEILPQAEHDPNVHSNVIRDARIKLRKVRDFLVGKVGAEAVTRELPRYHELTSTL